MNMYMSIRKGKENIYMSLFFGILLLCIVKGFEVIRLNKTINIETVCERSKENKIYLMYTNVKTK